MSPDEFRKHGHRLIEWIAAYMERVETLPVLSRVEPGAIRAELPASPPEDGEDFEAVLADLDRVILPGVTHWSHPGFFAYFPSNASGPGILGELVSAGLNTNGMLWETCPASTELEITVMDWLRQAIGLPGEFRGVIQDTASVSTLVALLTARERSTRGGGNRQGLAGGGRLTVYTSSEAHSSVAKAARIAGFGDDGVRLVAVDSARAMRPDALETRIEEDLSAGSVPCAVVATIGTTSSTAVDPIASLAEVAARYRLWLHVDAALAGSAAILPELAQHFQGIDRVDSLVLNPHKWLFTNFDCSAYFVRDPLALQETFGAHPEYLRTGTDGAVTHFKDWGIALGRRFRSLKLWFVLRYHGLSGLRAQLRAHLALARRFESFVDGRPDLEKLAPVPFQTICFRWHPPGLDDEATLERTNREILDRIRASGEAYLTHTRLEGRLALRVSIGQTWTRDRHVARLIELVEEAVAGCAVRGGELPR